MVALFIPVAQEWAARFGYSISRLLLPMNHVVILAGTCTLIGTSTNLIVNSLLNEHGSGLPGWGSSTSPGSVRRLRSIGIVYVLALPASGCCPSARVQLPSCENAREYSVEARVLPGGALVGRTIAEVGLRSMQFAYVLDIARGGPAADCRRAGPGACQADDRVTFVGVVEAVKELRRIPGLSVARRPALPAQSPAHSQRCLVEIVLSARAPMIGRTMREADFAAATTQPSSRSRAMARACPGKLGDVPPAAGRHAARREPITASSRRNRYNRDFLLVSSLQDSAPSEFRARAARLR